MTPLALWCIRFYREVVSPELPAGICNMEPSCSQYGLEAVQTYGARKGIPMIWARLKRCGQAAKRPDRNVLVHDPVK